MKNYAQINNDNVVVGVQTSQKEIIHDSLIEVESYDPTLIGKVYIDGTFTEVEKSSEELKALKFIEVKIKADEYYNNYLSQFPLSEQETFKQRGSEAIAYKSDNTSLTPYIDASLPVNSTAEARAIEINSVYEKSLYIATLSGIARDARTQVENCTTIEELNSIQ